MNAQERVRQTIDEQQIEFVDLRIADLVGRLRHLTVPSESFANGEGLPRFGFDASNFGYRGVAQSDMVCVPDPETAAIEKRGEENLLTLLCDLRDAETGEEVSIDPRGIARRAECLLSETDLGDELVVSPEFEFYVYRRATYENETARAGYELTSLAGSPGAPVGSAYHAPLPADRGFALRNEISRQIIAQGTPLKYHHHEVGARGQQEIELGFAPLRRMADTTLIVKHLIRNVAHEFGWTATFLPKPMLGEAGSGMHLHQYLLKDGRNQFAGEDGLSDIAQWYVGGLLDHGASLMAFTNPSTNSYRRLVPGFEAPIDFVCASGDRTAAVRIPSYARGESQRIELRTMDATCNPYLAYSAILCAGVDGILRRLPLRERNGAETPAAAPSSLTGALNALESDHDYLTKSGVFSEAFIEHWIDTKRREVREVALRPHPYEFALYYDL